MTPRKPPGMSFDAWIESQIRVAQESGDFDDLAGRGESIVEPGERYDPDWWAKSLMKREKLSLLPPQLEIKRVVEKTWVALVALADERRVRETIQSLNAKIRRVNSQASHGPPSTQAPVDEEAWVERWRIERARR